MSTISRISIAGNDAPRRVNLFLVHFLNQSLKLARARAGERLIVWPTFSDVCVVWCCSLYHVAWCSLVVVLWCVHCLTYRLLCVRCVQPRLTGAEAKGVHREEVAAAAAAQLPMAGQGQQQQLWLRCECRINLFGFVRLGQWTASILLCLCFTHIPFPLYMMHMLYLLVNPVSVGWCVCVCIRVYVCVHAYVCVHMCVCVEGGRG